MQPNAITFTSWSGGLKSSQSFDAAIVLLCIDVIAQHDDILGFLHDGSAQMPRWTTGLPERSVDRALDLRVRRSPACQLNMPLDFRIAHIYFADAVFDRLPCDGGRNNATDIP